MIIILFSTGDEWPPVVIAALCILTTLIFFRAHILHLLIFIEFMTLVTLVLMAQYLRVSKIISVILFLYLTLSVCEACLGVRLLIKISRIKRGTLLRNIN